MIEELKKKLKKIESNDINIDIKNKITKEKDELNKMKRNIDNIIFCRLQKKLKKNNQILLNNENNFSEEILLMRALTQLNIIPKSEENDTINSIDNTKENEKYLYFLLSKNKAKSVNKIIEPILFWKNLLKFKDLKDLKAK